MGSLWMSRSDMDGDNTSPFSRHKLEQIKKILHRDVDKELERAIKIAKEVNSRIYQVHRNILVYQKLNPSRNVSFTQNKTSGTETKEKNELKEGSSNVRSCDSSRQVEPSQVSSISRSSSSETRLTNASTSSSQTLSDKSLGNISTSFDSSKPSTSHDNHFNFIHCTKCRSPNKRRIDLSENSRQVNVSNVESEGRGAPDKFAQVANILRVVCLDHDYLKENVWGIEAEHSSEKTETYTGSSSVTHSPPLSKKVKMEPVTALKSTSSILNGVDMNYVKYDEFLNSSLYFDQDLVTCDQSLFSHASIDLLSICDIPPSFDVEQPTKINQVSFPDSIKNNCNSVDSSSKLGITDTSSKLIDTSPVKLRFTIGTVSKQLLASEKSCHETHIWKIYVRNTFAEDASLHNYIAKIRFVIHDSYAPNNLIERKEPPYEITRRGWGEFPIRVQIFFRFNKKPVCLVHQLSLVRNVINILTLGIQKNYEMVIPNLIKSFNLPKESSFGSCGQSNGLWKHGNSDSAVKDLFDFKIKEINTVAKINELISQEAVPNVYSSKRSDHLVNLSTWPVVPVKKLKAQLFEEGDFVSNFSDLKQIKLVTSSIGNYCERILFLLDVLPIITPHSLLTWYKRVHSYSCPSQKIFDSWPIGKQRASEFARARMIKSLAASDPGSDWSTNEIVLFTRNKEDNFQNDPMFKASLVSFAKSVALQQLSELETQLAESQSSGLINIL